MVTIRSFVVAEKFLFQNFKNQTHLLTKRFVFYIIEKRGIMKGREVQLRKHLNKNRFLVIILCLLVAATIVLYFTNIINPWYCLVLESYLIGMIFLINTSVQEIKHGKPLPIINAIFGLLFFALSVFLIAFGITAGYMAL